MDIRITDLLYRGVNHVEDLGRTSGTFDTALAKEFLRAFSLHGGLTLHVRVLYGENTHHMIEAVFKALGRTLSQAVSPEPRATGVVSSKGAL